MSKDNLGIEQDPLIWKRQMRENALSALAFESTAELDVVGPLELVRHAIYCSPRRILELLGPEPPAERIVVIGELPDFGRSLSVSEE